MNDLNKKRNKCILFSTNTELFRKYLESILFFANPKKIFYFVINRKESKTNSILLDRYEFKNGHIKFTEKARKIENKSHLQNYLIVH